MARALPARQATVQLQLQAIGGHDTQARLAEIAAPTLVIHGTEDKMIPVANGELIASLIPGARLEILERRRPHVLVGAARAVGRADPRPRPRLDAFALSALSAGSLQPTGKL